MPRRLTLAARAALAILFLSCGHAPRPRAPAANHPPPSRVAAANESRVGSATYLVTVDNGSSVLSVDATFASASSDRIGFADVMKGFLSLERLTLYGASLGALALEGHALTLDACRQACRFRYRVDLAKLAASGHRALDHAAKVGDAILSPSSIWLVRPDDMDVGEATVHVQGSGQLVTGLWPAADAPNSYRFDLATFDEGSYTSFGPAEVDHVPAFHTTVAILGKHDESRTTLHSWIENAESWVGEFYGTFPVPSATLFLVPARGSNVVFGKVLAPTGASLVLLVGSRFSKPKDDWVLVHELLHLGFPAVPDDRGLSEGVATLYEPIVRLRHGQMDEARMWRELAENTPRGFEAARSPRGIEDADDIEGMYWGNVVLLLEWEALLRAQSHGEMGVELVLRKLVESGYQRLIVGKAETFAELDRLSGYTALAEILAAHREPRKIDNVSLLAPFGVDGTGKVVVQDGPAAAWRRAFVDGPKH